MRHKNLQEYFEEVKDLYHSANAEIYKYRQELEFAEDFAAMDKGVSANNRLAKAKQAYEIDGGRIKRETIKKIDDVRSAYLEHTDYLYGLKASAIDNDVVCVLNAVKHTEREIERLAERFNQNPTMLRILVDHCEKHSIDSRLAKSYSNRLIGARTDAESAFDSARALIKDKAWGNDETIAKIWSDSNRFNEVFNELSEKVSGIGEVAKSDAE